VSKSKHHGYVSNYGVRGDGSPWITIENKILKTHDQFDGPSRETTAQAIVDSLNEYESLCAVSDAVDKMTHTPMNGFAYTEASDKVIDAMKALKAIRATKSK